MTTFSFPLAIQDTILQLLAVPLCPQTLGGFAGTLYFLLGYPTLVRQRGSFSKLGPASDLGLPLALLEFQLLSSLGAKFGHHCPLHWSQLLGLLLELAAGSWTMRQHSGAISQDGVRSCNHSAKSSPTTTSVHCDLPYRGLPYR